MMLLDISGQSVLVSLKRSSNLVREPQEIDQDGFISDEELLNLEDSTRDFWRIFAKNHLRNRRISLSKDFFNERGMVVYDVYSHQLAMNEFPEQFQEFMIYSINTVAKEYSEVIEIQVILGRIKKN